MDVGGLVGWFDRFAGQAMGENYEEEIKNRKIHDAWVKGHDLGNNGSTALVMMGVGGWCKFSFVLCYTLLISF